MSIYKRASIAGEGFACGSLMLKSFLVFISVVIIKFIFFMMLPSNKRPAADGDDDGLQVMVPDPKRRANLKNAVRNIMRLGGLSQHTFVLSWLEAKLQLWVRQEVERSFQSYFHPSSRFPLNQIEASRGRGLQLRFVKKLPPTIYTGIKVEDEDRNPIRIILVDATNQTMVSSSGSASSIKVEIVAVNGDFGADDWTENEFNASVLREREGKRPLVTGDLYVTLVDGVGSVDNVIFTDNSSWMKSGKFRLGARVVQRISGEVTIREARSEAFVVKERRGELYKKHHPPFPHDEVWRLEKISKDGVFHRRLISNNIHTVKDFLRLHVTDPSALRNMRGRISNREWDAIIKHALSCVRDDNEVYTYNIGVAQKHLVEDAKTQAYNNVGNLVPIDRRAIMSPSMPLPNMLLEPHSTLAPGLLLQQPDFSVANQDQPSPSQAFNQCSTSYGNQVGNANQLQVSPTLDGPAIQALISPIVRNNSFGMGGIFPNNGDNSFSLFPDGHFTIDDAIWPSASPPCGQGSEFVFPLDTEPAVDAHSRRMGEAGWLKLRAVIQWRPFRRRAARSRLWLPEGICI